MNNKLTTCCFTGHRTVPIRHRRAVTEAIEYHVRDLRNHGFTRFIAGGALGFDTLAAETVLAMAESDPGIRLILAIPCINQTEKWTNLPNGLEHLRTYKDILGRAHDVIYVSERTYFDGCMKKRNQYMVDSSSVCIAYWNGSRGGTSQTVRLAESGGLQVINIFGEIEDADSFADDDRQDTAWCDIE
ncbi:MAG: DUF1273 family protein [Clostridia bacterium]|nr:DUF1273 family protein [Clostridia bacterium]MBQ8511877.1 DUF1273 family protein [Clostridia bacterium]